MKKILIGAAVCSGLLSISGASSAVQYSWNLNSSAANAHTISFGSTPSGQTLYATAFRSGSTSDASGALIDADVNPDGSYGLGVQSSGETSPDDRLLDNRSGFDVLVLDSGITGFDWGSLKIGSILSGSACSSCDSTPGIQYWAGGDYITGGAEDSTYGFNKLCLTGTCSGTGNQTLAAAGFSTHSASNQSVGGPGSLPAGVQGRYLVVSGSLDGGTNGWDKFKISSGGGYGQTPEPQSMALIGIGLLAMLGMRRRSATARRFRMVFGPA